MVQLTLPKNSRVTPGNRDVWIERFKKLGPIARDHNVMIVVKQHGGETGTGEACAEITRAVDDPGTATTMAESTRGETNASVAGR